MTSVGRDSRSACLPAHHDYHDRRNMMRMFLNKSCPMNKGGTKCDVCMAIYLCYDAADNEVVLDSPNRNPHQIRHDEFGMHVRIIDNEVEAETALTDPDAQQDWCQQFRRHIALLAQ